MSWFKRPAFQIDTPFPALRLDAPRLYLRPPLFSDWAAWASLRADSRDALEPFEPQWHEQALSEKLFSSRLMRQSSDWQLGRAQAFLLFTQANDQLIGGMNINHICRGAAQYASLGYWLGTPFTGQGFMSEALLATLKHCFGTLLLHRVHASTLPHNTRSRRLLEKGGFKEEGLAEKYIQINGVWEDHVLYGLPAERWDALCVSGL